MATPSEMIIAIDAAIESGISGPGRMTAPDGRSIEYRSLDELFRLREYYVKKVRGDNSTIRLGDFNT